MNRRIPAALAALMLGVGFAGACGNGDREQVEQSNDGEQLPEGSNTQIETDPGPTQTSQGETQTTVTQTEDGG
ncbi:MAG: hypothetical protein ACLGHP_06295 [Vicinamibacteria bacterium]